MKQANMSPPGDFREADFTRREWLQLTALGTLTPLAPAWLTGCGGSDASLSYSATIADARTLIGKLLADTATPAITVALVDDQRVIWSEAFGRIDAAGMAPSTETRFPIASVSKIVTTVAAMILVDRKLIDLDAPFVRYVTAFRMQSPEYTDITVRMLLAHSSGLPGDDYPNGSTLAPLPDHAQKVLSGLASRRLKHTPGQMAVYCNDGFTLIELLVQAVTGKVFTDFVRDEILVPLGMSHSVFTSAALSAGSYAPAFHEDGTPWPLECINVYASGGLYSTPEDMCRLTQMLLNGGRVGQRRLLSELAIAGMATDQTRGLTLNPATDNQMHYGLGWDGVHEGALAKQGIDCWHKNGATYLQSAQMLVLPQEGLALMVMGSSESYNAHALATEIVMRALVERGSIAAMPAQVQPTASPVRTASGDELAALSGVYAQSRAIYRLRTTSDDRLEMATWRAGQWSVYGLLVPHEDGRFSFDAAPYPLFRFALADGRRYLLSSTRSGYGYCADELPLAHRIVDTVGATLLPAWQARVGRRWVAVTFDPSLTALADGNSPHLALQAVPLLPSYVMLSIPALQVADQVLDPRASAERALMCLKLPLIDTGRDLADLVVRTLATATGAEDWLEWNSTQFRPFESIPLLTPGANAVAIGAEGHAQWRRLPVRASQLSIAASRGWKLYRDDGESLQLLDQSINGSKLGAAAPADAYLLLYGTAGGAVSVTL